MTIYKLTQETWNNRQLSDFDLPHTLGYFKEEWKAEAIRSVHSLKVLTSRAEDGLFTSQSDYNVIPLTVIE